MCSPHPLNYHLIHTLTRPLLTGRLTETTLSMVLRTPRALFSSEVATDTTTAIDSPATTASNAPLLPAEPSSHRIRRNKNTRRFRHAQRTWFYGFFDLVAVSTATVTASLLSIYAWAPSVGVVADHFFSLRNGLLTLAVITLWLGSIALNHGYSHRRGPFRASAARMSSREVSCSPRFSPWWTPSPTTPSSGTSPSSGCLSACFC